MLAIKRSAGVAPEVNLRILLHAGNEACKVSNLALKPRVDVIRSQNIGIIGPQKGLMSSKNVFKSFI